MSYNNLRRIAVFIACFYLSPIIRENLHAQQKVFWTDNSGSTPAIHCVEVSGQSCLDKANPSNTVLLNLTPSIDSPGGLVIDEKNQKIIFVNSLNPGKIERCNLDGTSRETIVTLSDTPLHIAIDQVNDKIYWSSFDGIFKSGTDGSNAGKISEIPGSSFVGIGVDSAASSLFWIEGTSVKNLYESDLNSVSPVTLYTFSAVDGFFGMALDETADKIYFPKYASVSAEMSYYTGYSSGGSLGTLLPLSSANYYGYGAAAIDFPESNIYYGNTTDMKIYKTSLSSVNPLEDTFVTTPGFVTGLALSCGKYAVDSDGDKTSDCREECDTDPLKTTPGTCGCNTVDLDTDADGTPDCMDACENDESKVAPGMCGCGQEEPGVCGCGLIEDINADGIVVCVKTRQLAPNTKIENPPIVEVEGSEVTIVLEKFTKPTLTLKKKKKKNNKNSITAFDFYDYSVEIKAGGLKVRYDIQLTKVGGTKRDIKKLTSKKNELTVKNLPPGNYNVQYRAVITQNGKDAAKTGFSPSAAFSIL